MAAQLVDLLMMSTAEIGLHPAPVQFWAAVDQAGSGALTVRFVAHQFAGLHVRAPQAVTHIAGTIGSPSFSGGGQMDPRRATLFRATVSQPVRIRGLVS